MSSLCVVLIDTQLHPDAHTSAVCNAFQLLPYESGTVEIVGGFCSWLHLAKTGC